MPCLVPMKLSVLSAAVCLSSKRKTSTTRQRMSMSGARSIRVKAQRTCRILRLDLMTARRRILSSVTPRIWTRRRREASTSKPDRRKSMPWRRSLRCCGGRRTQLLLTAALHMRQDKEVLPLMGCPMRQRSRAEMTSIGRSGNWKSRFPKKSGILIRQSVSRAGMRWHPLPGMLTSASTADM